ncbi:MAG: hypothetical protein HYX27_19335 [Acidobacteria bacterium]|nr:hypothetical protein [Acidobacteriota bacterium]
MTNEDRAKIARENGAKSKGPVTPEGKEKSARNAITHGMRATALKLIVPPHSACLVNEDRHEFYNLFDTLIAKFRPADQAEISVVREIVECQWKIERNKKLETAIYNRELMRQNVRVVPSLPELRQLEISIAAEEALTGNKTLAELRKSTLTCQRAIGTLQRRLVGLQRNWAPAAGVPPDAGADREANDFIPKRTEQEQPQPAENTERTFHVNGPVTPNVINLYREIFHPNSAEFIGHEMPTDQEVA